MMSEDAARRHMRLGVLVQTPGHHVGWNVVTTAYAKSSAVFGRSHPPHAERYAMAEEFVAACRLLWDSWDDDAFTADKKSGEFVRPGSLHVPHFKGKYFA